MGMAWMALLACGPAEGPHGSHGHAHGEHAPEERGDHGHAKGDEHTEGHGHHDDVHHRFDDPERWAKTFDDPERDTWQQPAKVIAALELSPGMAVADIGAGTGYFNPHLAEAVGDEGEVIAIDIEPKMVAYMNERAVRDGTPQVEARLTTPDAHGLGDGEVDRVLIVDTYHHIRDRTSYFAGLKAALKPGGKLVVVDLTKEAPFGPPAASRLTAEEVTTELNAAGWTPAGQEELPHQYVLGFVPN